MIVSYIELLRPQLFTVRPECKICIVSLGKYQKMHNTEV